jgi:hypothetical protein
VKWTFVIVNLILVLSVALMVGRGGRPGSAVLVRDPYFGLACRGETPCRRIGLAVWLERKALGVRAIVDRHSLSLHTGRGDGAYRRGLFWQGVFTDGRAQEFVDEYPHELVVEIRAVAQDGHVLVTRTRVPVSAGYG